MSWALDKKYDDLFNDVFKEFWNETFPKFNDWFNPSVLSKVSFPKLDLSEENGKYVVELQIPGYKKEDIRVTAYGNVINIAGDAKSQEQGARKYLYREIKKSSFSRSFELEDADVDNLKAEFKPEEALLVLTIPRINAHGKDKKKEIPIT